MQDRTTISKGLQEIKKKYKVTQKELGEIAGVSESTVSHWIKGKTDAGIKCKDQLQLIADHYGEPYSIFERTPTEEEKASEQFYKLVQNSDLYLNVVDGLNVKPEQAELLQSIFHSKQELTITMAYLETIWIDDYIADLEKAKANKEQAVIFFRKLEFLNILVSQFYKFISDHNIEDLNEKEYLFTLSHLEGNYPKLQSYQAEKRPKKIVPESAAKKIYDKANQDLETLGKLKF